MKQLGFGCVRLTYNLTYRKAISNLQTAYDCGVTHFDVARLYGFGTAEKILGEFIKDKRDKVTVTSKFGYYPGNPLMSNLYVQNFARFAYRMLKNTPTKKVAQGAANEIVLQKNFNIADAQKSLETSLRALQTDYIDNYLLHEPTIPEACHPDIINFLERQKEKGTIREYGLGSFVDKIEHNIPDLPDGYTVIQSDCSFPYDFPLDKSWTSTKRMFFFSPFRYYQQTKELLAHDKKLAELVSQMMDIDVNRNLLDLFLLHQLDHSFDSTTLFTSSHNTNIKKTIDKWFLLQKQGAKHSLLLNEVKQMIQDKLKSTVG